MAFAQLIEYKTHKGDEISAITDKWMQDTQGKRTASHGVVIHDREHPDTYYTLVEFPSYDEAMKNSALPETSKYAEQIAALCDAPPVFHNCDVVREEDY